MIQTISESDFIQAFYDMDRKDQFSYNGLKALYEYMESCESEENTIKLDVIAVCCEFCEYESIDEYLKENNTDTERKDYDDDNDYKKAVMEEIEDKTTLIKIDDESFIVGSY